MNPRLLDIVRNSQDAHLGQTLLRLAQLAQMRHRMVATRQAALVDGEFSTEDGAEGIGSEAGLQPPRIGHASGQDRLHREVDR